MSPEKAALDTVSTEMNTPKTMELAAPFNFGPASSRDTVLYTCHCPGYAKDETQPIGITEQKQNIHNWVEFMKEKQGITQVIALLDDNEHILPSASDNEESVDLRDVYTNAQIPFLIQPMRDVNAYSAIMELIDSAAAKEGGKVVVHCTGGVGRAGRVASAWLVHRYGCSPLDATNEMLEAAAIANVKRRGTAEQLQAWINSCQPNVDGCCD